MESPILQIFHFDHPLAIFKSSERFPRTIRAPLVSFRWKSANPNFIIEAFSWGGAWVQFSHWRISPATFLKIENHPLTLADPLSKGLESALCKKKFILVGGSCSIPWSLWTLESCRGTFSWKKTFCIFLRRYSMLKSRKF